MTRRLAAAALAALAATGAGAAAAAPSPEGRDATAVGVSQREFRITAYRKVVPPGPVRFNVRNFGEDTHNLVVRGPRGVLAVSGDIDSGTTVAVAATLRRPGRYSLLCTRADHLRRGMRTSVTVRRAR